MDYPVLEEILHYMSSIEHERPQSRIVVHCTAGVGRTGSLLCMYNAVQTIDHYYFNPTIPNPRISIFGILR